MKLLLVEDDEALAKALLIALRNEGFSVDHVATGNEAIAHGKNNIADIIILDLGLPDIDGLTVLKELRANKIVTPMLILTARDDLSDKITALDGGADDYLSKPFEIKELMARIRALGRRMNSSISSVITAGRVSLDSANHHVEVDAIETPLSRREYTVLKALMENVGRIQTKAALENKLYSWGEEISSNAIEVHISNLRKKMPEGFIKTVRGVGYTIDRSSS
ncbi:response regulator [marine gamma proteobacterium HTCC2143]|uniref:Response regulator n=1 Tax=marine gamma proteobacterium HTCC2143 TaxID=247633 RepID=A0YB49_9GAMM|nr:response regulator [marine gamma proteobacterium HTCC2143]